MTTVIVPMFGFLNNRFKALQNISKVARLRRLSLSNSDEVGENFIALDVVKRKLLFAKKTSPISSCLIIDVNHLKACTIQKEYRSINAGELKTKKLYHFLKNIFLHLVFKNGSRSLSLPLFDVDERQQVNIEILEAKASKWENLLSSMLIAPAVERA